MSRGKLCPTGPWGPREERSMREAEGSLEGHDGDGEAVPLDGKRPVKVLKRRRCFSGSAIFVDARLQPAVRRERHSLGRGPDENP
eukprot:5768506-Pyramimonas_sp.AAC.1